MIRHHIQEHQKNLIAQANKRALEAQAAADTARVHLAELLACVQPDPSFSWDWEQMLFYREEPEPELVKEDPPCGGCDD